ncbi:4-alpha-glucanotransferase [Vallicoccus soli]|uniref:4-alpha-glucanotransferase n=1 Tax=Vallicoccus soli TaxID=2339232 RepID=A0A3A3YZE8_9ACTN|nr:4-alpha-glucanotransferase [Vallicoccus soli]RJK97121.1 4-alpha-glucanotransferase [Vallicoccus soli]
MTADSALDELASSYGVATGFVDWQGRPTDVPEETVRAVLAALGVDASTPEAVRRAAAERADAPWRRLAPVCTVTRQGRAPWVRAHVPHGDPVRVHVELEEGGRRELRQVDHWVDPREVDGVLTGAATFEVPGDLPLGYHRLVARSGEREESGALVVTPAWLGLPASLGDRRAWGFTAQLYSVRSERSWGHGDLADLAELGAWSARELGAGFVLVNPLHAPDPVPPIEPSPYLPSTRRFVSPLYLRVEDVPEYAYLGGPERSRVQRLAKARRATNEQDVQLDRSAVWKAKSAALALVHAVERSPRRQAAFAAFVAREGQGLVDFATWCALAEVHGAQWQEWPQELRDPRSPAVARAREELRERVDLHCWMQWVLDEQLARAQRECLEAGMPLGVVHDLAVGVHPTGADAWSLQDVLARDVNVGAPPDAFNQQGQDWSQPPWRPDRLAELGYAPFRDMIRTILRHAGGIRVDHVLGLFRLWWVPAGAAADRGTYVRYDAEAMVGVLALEAARAGAVVVGEDLGTVEPGVREHLAERGVLGTSILWFERDGEGRPLPPERWRELTLAAVTTHDLPPTAGYLQGEHIRIRSELGLLTRDVEEERRIDAEEQAAWLALLRERGLVPEDPSPREVVEGLHRLLAQSPSRLLGVALPDATGDVRALNQPGTSDEYPNWRLPLSDGDRRPLLLEEVVRSERARALAAAVGGAPLPAHEGGGR